MLRICHSVVMVVVVLAMVMSTTPARADAACRFQLGFAALHDLLPGIVGTCTENEGHNPANGDGIQHTSTGLLVWRKADNWTAFTDGYRTWIAGPTGLVTRLNTERFLWEADVPVNPTRPVALSPVVPLPTTVVYSDRGIDILSGFKLGTQLGSSAVLAWVRNSTAAPVTVYVSALLHGAATDVTGKATGTASDLQPGQTRLVQFLSGTPAADVTGVTWEVNTVVPGEYSSPFISATALQIEAGSPARALITITNSDVISHTGIVTLAVSDPRGSVLGYASGAFTDLASSQPERVVGFGPLDALPNDALYSVQMSNVAGHTFYTSPVQAPGTIFCDTDPAWTALGAREPQSFATLMLAQASLPGAVLHRPC